MMVKWLLSLTCVALIATTGAADKGVHVGCFIVSAHNETKSMSFAKNCFDYCASQFYR